MEKIVSPKNERAKTSIDRCVIVSSLSLSLSLSLSICLLIQVADNQALVTSLKDSPHFSAFRDDSKTWENRLHVLSEGLFSLQSLQRKWVYLEPIFGRGALQQELSRFQKVDHELVSGKRRRREICTDVYICESRH